MIPKSLLDKPTLMQEGDYIQDGLVFCHWCNTPKQCEINFLGSKRIVACLCQHLVDEQAEQEEKEKRIAHEKYIMRLRQEAFSSSMMIDWTFENSGDSKLIQIVKNYADNFKLMFEQGEGLLLYGDVGNGKTYAAACVVNDLINKGVPCLMTNFARLINTLQGMYEGKQEYIDSLNDYKLLVIDDLGIERKTDFMDEQVFSILDARYQSGLPLIITTNLTNDELKHPADRAKSRIYDRLLERCHPVEVTGASKRKANLKNNFQKIQDILEGKNEIHNT